jgi:hypothetical protein
MSFLFYLLCVHATRRVVYNCFNFSLCYMNVCFLFLVNLCMLAY